MKKRLLTLFITFAFIMNMLIMPAMAIQQVNPKAKHETMIHNNTYSNQAGEVVLDTPSAFENNYQVLAKDIKKTRLSPIEQMFNGKDVDSTGVYLKQAGYDIFSGPNAGTNTTGKYGSDYRLSIGEKVSIYLYGDSVDIMAISGSNLLSSVIKTDVDSNGCIFIQGIGVIPAENKTIGEVENAVNHAAAKKFKSIKAKVGIASGQDFSVFVYGQVNRPGKVLLSNNSSFIDALGAAGGVKKTGSLRKITYTSGKKKVEVDLYKDIFSGNDNNIILRPNDRIFVNNIGNVVAIKNGVANPGIYEVKETESLQKITEYAGGLLPGTQATEVTLTALNMATMERSASNVAWKDAKNIKLHNGDSIEFRELYNVAENIVTLQGNVKHPGTFAYKQGMRLSDVLKSEKELLEETFITQAVIRRVSGKDNTIETIPIFLKEFFEGTSDPLLQPKDVINIYKNTNSQFVDVYGCISTPKHITYKENMRLDAILTDVQFVVSKSETAETDKTSAEHNATYNEGEEEYPLVAGTFNDNDLIPAEDVAVEIISEDGSTQLYYLYDIMINSNSIKSIQLLPYDKVFFRPLRSNEILKNVKVSGFVKKPGVFKFIEGKRLVDMIDMAGGLTEESDLRGIVYRRTNLQGRQIEYARKNVEKDIQLLEGRLASGYKQDEKDVKAKAEMLALMKEDKETLSRRYTGQIALNIKSNNLAKIKDSDNILVQDGDEIYIPRISNQVSVIGEVYNEQSFMYRKGSTVRDYINEVGGYTPNANKFRIYKVGVNGMAQKVGKGASVESGDIIVVPRKIANNDWITPTCNTLQSLASLFVMAFAIKKW